MFAAVFLVPRKILPLATRELVLIYRCYSCYMTQPKESPNCYSSSSSNLISTNNNLILTEDDLQLLQNWFRVVYQTFHSRLHTRFGLTVLAVRAPTSRSALVQITTNASNNHITRQYFASKYCCYSAAAATTTLCLKKGYHPTTNDNFNNSCLIPVVFGTNITH